MDWLSRFVLLAISVVAGVGCAEREMARLQPPAMKPALRALITPPAPQPPPPPPPAPADFGGWP